MRLSALLKARPMIYADQRFSDGVGPLHRLVLRRYEAGDEAEIELRADFAHAFDAAGQALPVGLRWTLLGETGRPIAVGGLEPLADKGCWGAWGLTADLDRRAWAFARRSAAKVLDYAERELGARSIQALSASDPGAIRLLQRLGFAITGLPWEGPDGAFYLPMARTYGGSGQWIR